MKMMTITNVGDDGRGIKKMILMMIMISQKRRRKDSSLKPTYGNDGVRRSGGSSGRVVGYHMSCSRLVSQSLPREYYSSVSIQLYKGSLDSLDPAKVRRNLSPTWSHHQSSRQGKDTERRLPFPNNQIFFQVPVGRESPDPMVPHT
ncbi:hypothetical protein PoB_000447200 [Plakobranchus ocellatus]|uniref:Uncharacterized protein n=1 Tax=Plakobranchus ocellatus TaxID=259542 RepID=A0AAV3Y693_9GAST|nr:hypothetical protein PoB_000447200 [Plakobranchus ocellatus]